jgi:hypothetical protein
MFKDHKVGEETHSISKSLSLSSDYWQGYFNISFLSPLSKIIQPF